MRVSELIHRESVLLRADITGAQQHTFAVDQFAHPHIRSSPR